MSDKNIFSSFLSSVFKLFLNVDKVNSSDVGTPKNILVVRQHNQFGDLLASVSLFRAIKESFPDSVLTVIVSPDNYYAITKNKFINKFFVFDKKKLFSPAYFKEFQDLLNKPYDLTIVPATVSVSSTSCLIARFANSKIRIGPSSLNGKTNSYAFLFDRRVALDWRKYPDSHISDFGLDILRPFGIKTKDFTSEITFNGADTKTADEFISSLNMEKDDLLIGIHVGAGKPPNRWALKNYLELIDMLDNEFKTKFYFTGSNSDGNELNFIKKNIKAEAGYFMNKSIPELAAVISKSDLFITNDTGVMHVAGSTSTPQISIFGPTNPFNWAPIGPKKFFIRKSELIDDVKTEEVFNLCKLLIDDKRKSLVENEN